MENLRCVDHFPRETMGFPHVLFVALRVRGLKRQAGHAGRFNGEYDVHRCCFNH